MNSQNEGQTGIWSNGMSSGLCMVLGARLCEEAAKYSFIEGSYSSNRDNLTLVAVKQAFPTETLLLINTWDQVLVSLARDTRFLLPLWDNREVISSRRWE